MQPAPTGGFSIGQTREASVINPGPTREQVGLFCWEFSNRKPSVFPVPPEANEPTEIDCPANCPNRQRETVASAQVKLGSYLFALLASLFLGYQVVAADRREEPLSPFVWMPCLMLIGTALGVQIDPAQLADLISSGKK